MPRQTGSPRTRYRKDRQCWEVSEYRDRKLVRLSSGHRSREEADLALAEIIFERRTKVTRTSDAITVGEILAYYLTHHAPTMTQPQNALFCHRALKGYWAEMKVEEVNKATVTAFIKERDTAHMARQKQQGKANPRPYAADSHRRNLEHLKASLNFAMQENIITVAPHVWMPKKGKARDRYLTRPEAARLIRAARNGYGESREYLPMFILIALYTGARKGAIFDLRWSDVDFKSGLINFKRGEVSKNKGRAIVPMPAQLLCVLRRYKARRGTDIGFVVQRNQKRIGDIQKSFNGAKEAAGLSDICIHTLRHTCASWMIQRGVPSHFVAKWLGHTTSIMVERTYGHLAPDHLETAKNSWTHTVVVPNVVPMRGIANV